SGGSVTLTYTATVTAASGAFPNSTPPSLTDTATVTSASQSDVVASPTASSTVYPQLIDLSITQSVNNSTPYVDNDITYTITVSNTNGYSAATDVDVTDILPAGELLVSSSGGSYASNVWSVGTLAPGACATLTIFADVTALGSQTNTATVSSFDQPNVSGNPSASVTVNPQQVIATGTSQIDLNVTLVPSNTSPNVGTNDIYTVTVTNTTGFAGATNVVLANVLSSGESYVANSASASLGSYNSVTGVWTVGSLAAGQSAMLTYTATINAFTPLTNSASANADQTDLNANPSASVTVNPQEIDLSVTKTVNISNPNVGTNVIYKVTLSNAADYSAASSICLKDLLPAGETFVSANPSTGAYSPTTGYWSGISLNAGAMATLTVTATVNAFAPITNTATVMSAAQPDYTVNPTASVTINPQEIDLNVTKTVNISNPNINTNVTYTVIVSNATGYSAATDVALKDLLPSSETLVSATASLGTYTPSSGAWCVGTLASGSCATLTVVATVTAAAYPSVTNTACITAADQTDIGTALSASATINPQEIDLTVTNTVSNSMPNVGANVTYTVTVSNATGYTQATSVLVNDLLPASETLVSAAASALTSYSGGVWNVGNLNAGATATLTIVATVTGAALPSATDTAHATDAQYDANPNPLASATVYPQEIDLSIVKTESTPQICEGSNVTYTVTVSNAAGYATATNVVVTDQLPSGLTFVSTTPSTGAYNQSTGVWSISTLASGSSATLTVVAKAACYGVDVNTACVTSATQTDIGTTLSSSVTLVIGASVNGTVYVDANGDLTQDNGEQGASGAVVELIDSNGYVVLTTTTNSTGQYSFAGVAPGNYQVEFFAPTGYQFDVINGVAPSNNNNNCNNDNYGSCGNGNGCGSGFDNCGSSYGFTCGGQNYSGYCDSSCGAGYQYSCCSSGKSYCYSFCDNDHGGGLWLEWLRLE
ncbi:MAG: SdrD B-like domain-containing protein, partial [Tepidisphaeraceae bacterium]